MREFFERYVVPGLVIQAIMVGGGYSTGRELVEFFLRAGPTTALIGMGLTALVFSLGSMASFELARLFSAYDYRSFTRVLLGRFWVTYEVLYLAGLVLTLSVVSSAAAELMAQNLGWPRLVSSVVFVSIVGALVFFGNRTIERIISAWSVVFYLVYGTLFLVVCDRFGPAVGKSLSAAPINMGAAGWGALTYTGYNIALLPALIFVARRARSRKEALWAGALAGPLILAPGFAFLMTLGAFYPAIINAPLPVTEVLQRLNTPWLQVLVTAVILGALVKTGAGMLHGFNERLSRDAAERGRTLPPYVRSGVAVGIFAVSVFLASGVGLVGLIAYGYRYSGLAILLIFVLPLFTRGLALIHEAYRAPEAATVRSV